MTSETSMSEQLSYLVSLAEAGRQARVVPMLLSSDLARTEAFYRNLGFRAELPDGASDRFSRLGVERDGIYLFFYTEPPSGTPAVPTMSGTIYAFPESVDALATQWREKVEFSWGPELMPYGLYEFGIQDPDGYYLAFAERRQAPR